MQVKRLKESNQRVVYQDKSGDLGEFSAKYIIWKRVLTEARVGDSGLKLVVFVVNGFQPDLDRLRNERLYYWDCSAVNGITMAYHNTQQPWKMALIAAKNIQPLKGSTITYSV